MTIYINYVLTKGLFLAIIRNRVITNDKLWIKKHRNGV